MYNVFTLRYNLKTIRDFRSQSGRYNYFLNVTECDTNFSYTGVTHAPLKPTCYNQ